MTDASGQRQRAEALYGSLTCTTYREGYQDPDNDIGIIEQALTTARQEALREARDYALACASERKAQAFELTKTVINDPRAVWLGCKASEAERIADKLDRLEPGEANQVVLSRGRRME